MTSVRNVAGSEARMKTKNTKGSCTSPIIWKGLPFGLINLGDFCVKAQAAFKMKIIYYDPVKSPPNRTTGGTDAGGEATTPYFELDPPPQWVPLDELLATSDVVSMHASLSASTRRMMSAPQFAKMKQGSYFVNMARGGLVDEEDLADALLSGHLAGAGIGEMRTAPGTLRYAQLSSDSS